MKCFVLGATGFIGNRVAQALRQAGHQVWGLVRSQEKAAGLEAQEIHPVLGDLADPASYAEAAAECSLLVHAAADYQADTAALDLATVEALLAAGKHGRRPKTLLYTSGVWVYGSTGETLVDETSPLAPPEAVSWRPAVEQKVVSATEVRGLVLRPGCVYGGRGSLTGLWFQGAHRGGALTVVGDGRNRWAMVHVDDLASAYVKAAESGLAGEVLNVTDRSRATVGEMAQAVAAATGYSGEVQHQPVAEARQALGPMAEALALDQHVDSRKAVRRLGWYPRHTGFVAETETYFRAWRAAAG